MKCQLMCCYTLTKLFYANSDDDDDDYYFVYSVIIVLICEFNSLSWIRHSLCSLDLSVECLFIAGFFSSGFVSLETSCSNCKIIKLLRGMHIIHEWLIILNWIPLIENKVFFDLLYNSFHSFIYNSLNNWIKRCFT